MIRLLTWALTQTGRAAIHEAARGGHVDTCKGLIQRGADVNAKEIVSQYHNE